MTLIKPAYSDLEAFEHIVAKEALQRLERA